MDRIYRTEDYDQHLCLKVPFLLSATLVYSARHIIFVALAYSPRFSDSFSFIRLYTEPWLVVVDLPALLVLLAWWQRRPTANSLWRKIWQAGRTLTSLTLVIQLGCWAYFQFPKISEIDYLAQSERFPLVSGVVNLLLLYYLWRSHRARDTFLTFPSLPPQNN